MLVKTLEIIGNYKIKGSFETDFSLPDGFVSYMVQHVVLEGVSRLVFYGLSNNKPTAHWVEGGLGQTFIGYFNSLTNETSYGIEQRVNYFIYGDARKGSGALGNDKVAPIEIKYKGVVKHTGLGNFGSFIYFFRSFIRSWRVGSLNEGNFSTAIKVINQGEALSVRKAYRVPYIYPCKIGIDDNGVNFIKKFD